MNFDQAVPGFWLNEKNHCPSEGKGHPKKEGEAKRFGQSKGALTPPLIAPPLRSSPRSCASRRAQLFRRAYAGYRLRCMVLPCHSGSILRDAHIRSVPGCARYFPRNSHGSATEAHPARHLQAIGSLLRPANGLPANAEGV